MNSQVKIVIIILGILVSLFAVVSLTMKQNENGSPEMTDIKSSHGPEERIITSFGLDENNSERTILLKNPDLMDTFINASEADISPYYYPKGPVVGYGKDMNGSIVVMIDEKQETNKTLIKEIYDHLSARGKSFHINSVPCKFISIGVAQIDIAKDTIP